MESAESPTITTARRPAGYKRTKSTSVVEVSAMFAAGTPHPSLRGVVLRYEGYADRIGRARHDPPTAVHVRADHHRSRRGVDRRASGARSHRAAALGFVRRRHHRWAGPRRPPRVGELSAGRPDTARRSATDGHADERVGQPTVPIDDVLGPFGGSSFSASETRRTGRRGSRSSTPRSGRGWPTPRPSTPAWSGRCAASPKAVARRRSQTGGELGWSHRRLIARYRDAVGLPPKLVARIVRFERLAALVSGDAVGRLGGCRPYVRVLRPGPSGPRGTCAGGHHADRVRMQAVNSVQDVAPAVGLASTS